MQTEYFVINSFFYDKDDDYYPTDHLVFWNCFKSWIKNVKGVKDEIKEQGWETILFQSPESAEGFFKDFFAYYCENEKESPITRFANFSDIEDACSKLGASVNDLKAATFRYREGGASFEVVKDSERIKFVMTRKIEAQVSKEVSFRKEIEVDGEIYYRDVKELCHSHWYEAFPESAEFILRIEELNIF